MERKQKTKTRGNGQGTVYKRGNTWTAEVRTFTGTVRQRKRKGGFQFKKDAVAYLPTLAAALSNAPVKTISFPELWEKWKETQTFKQLSKEKQDAYRIAYNKMQPLHALKDVRLASYDMQAEIIRPLSYYPARDVKRVLNGMFELALRMECVEKNFAPLLELPPIQEATKTIFTDEQIELIKRSDDPFADYVLLMIYMGLRPVELRGLTVDDVHFDEHYTDGGRKTAKDIPIAISDEAEPVLRRICDRASSGKLCTLSNDGFYNAFYALLSTLGIQSMDYNGKGKITPYSCRHTFVTRLTRKGATQPMIQKAARHTSYKTTQRYTHLDITDVLTVLNDVGNSK